MFMTYSKQWLVRQLFLTCSWLVHNLITIGSRIAHDFFKTFRFLHDLFMTCLLLVHNLLMTSSRPFCDFLMTLSGHVHDLVMPCSWLSHDFICSRHVHFILMTDFLLFHNLFINYDFFFMTCSCLTHGFGINLFISWLLHVHTLLTIFS